MFQVLSAYIARRGSLKGRNILELGSGTGLVGLVAGALGARVWITDQAFVLNPRNLVLPAHQCQLFFYLQSAVGHHEPQRRNEYIVRHCESPGAQLVVIAVFASGAGIHLLTRPLVFEQGQPPS